MSLVKVSAAAAPLKSDFAYTDPAAGGVTVSDTELALWVGGLLEGYAAPPLEVHQAIEQALKGIRDSGLQAGGAGVYTIATVTFNAPSGRDHKFNVDVSQGILPTPSTNAVHILVGGLYQRTPSASITTAVKRAREVWLEQVSKKAA